MTETETDLTLTLTLLRVEYSQPLQHLQISLINLLQIIDDLLHYNGEANSRCYDFL